MSIVIDNTNYMVAEKSTAVMHSHPIPLHDELALGILGRLTRLNGLSSMAAMIKLLRTRQTSSDSISLLGLLAEACGQEESVFSVKHSMLPIMYPISRYADKDRCADVKRFHIVQRGLSLPIDHVRWCTECSRTDIAKQGFSYWRRLHQIAGVDWCIDHHLPLICAPLETAVHAPGHPATSGSLSSTPSNATEEAAYPALQRLQQIMVGWLRSSHPLRLTAWTKVVGEHCRAAGLRVGEIGKRPVASDRIKEMLPASWLARHIPEILNKEPRAFIRKVDGACIDKHVTYPALACASILAVLFDSDEQVLSALDSVGHQLAKKPVKEDSRESALNAFLTGLGLHKACEKFGASVTDVEAALRQRIHKQPVNTLSLHQ